MPFSEFLYDLSLVLGASAVATLLCRRFKQPVVIGYIVTGFLIGPHLTAGLVRSEETIHTLSQLGIVFLLFTLGMEFQLKKLKEVGGAAILSTFLEINILVAAGYLAGRAFGWTQMDSLFLGALISISSTTITLKALADLGKSKDKFAQVVIGILIIEDLFAVVLIAILSGIGTTGEIEIANALWEMVRLGAFVAISLVLGFLVVPRLVHYAARFRSDEMLVILALGSCFVFSLFTVKIGYSVALGAFLIGIMFGEAREVAKLRTLLSPIRDMFSAIFFVSVGLLIEPGLLLEHPWAILILTLLIVVGKVFTCTLGTFLAGHSMHDSTRVGMGKAQIGEFSFIIAGMGLTLGVTSDFLFPIAVSLSVITTLLTPYLIKGTDRVIVQFEKSSPSILISYYNIYTRWAARFMESTRNTESKRALRTLVAQLLLFFMLIAGGLVLASFLAREIPALSPYLAKRTAVLQTGLWLLTMLLSLPVFIATFHKLKALGLLLADLGITGEAFKTRKQEVHGIIANGSILIGAAGLIAWVAAFSRVLLPRQNYPIALGAFLFILAFLLRHTFMNLYARSRDSLEEIFIQHPPGPGNGDGESDAAQALPEPHLVIWKIGSDDPGVGRLIGETALRTRTGASIVGLDRDGIRIINPGPEEEIHPEDRLLILGNGLQLEKAERELLKTDNLRSAPVP
ncbi:MAG: cation:proton antiporter [Fibrobacterota bacterium]|nr:cation:proton antiporter [Fibrobacterota bacterium]